MNESGMRIDVILDELVAEEAIRAASSARTAVLLAEATTLRLAESRSDQHGLAMRSLAAEISCATRLPEGTVIRFLNEAEILVNTLPATLEALTAGAISYRHAQVMASAAGSLPREARGAFERELLPVAASATAARFERTARHERERLHPETIETRTATAVAERSVELTPDADGMA
ncbi:13E12 repeat family protein [Herbiconiux sp. CPCC 205763]|uniref:13E12 repeat family protein n=1 Tax=Herbiconiux aconitum TaxID=2970913 RepID=A0ABT2GTV9_9MICO|nr:13E12 repeat family protein [Herbiconiux aconitum]MCS5719652.1 13E12 repeat family protein [Herbiconiux aconitum]